MTTATSTGHALSAAIWLDAHYLAAQPEYETMVRSAGFQSGWRILDAGCGGGSYLPLLSELLGPHGHISAVDLAPENVAQVKALIASGRVRCPADVRVGDVTRLPFAENVFHAVWSANVTQYLPDSALRAMLGEAQRVLRSGGRLAIRSRTRRGACWTSPAAARSRAWHWRNLTRRCTSPAWTPGACCLWRAPWRSAWG